jgi:hypothetical protein
MPKHELEQIKGIGPKTAQKLVAAGYKNLEAIALADPGELARIETISLAEARRHIKDAADLIKTGESDATPIADPIQGDDVPEVADGEPAEGTDEHQGEPSTQVEPVAAPLKAATPEEVLALLTATPATAEELALVGKFVPETVLPILRQLALSGQAKSVHRSSAGRAYRLR